MDATVNFDVFLDAAAAKLPTGKIVVLIDEYDEPLAKFLDKPEVLDFLFYLLYTSWRL